MEGGVTVLESALATFPDMGARITGDFSFAKYYDNFKKGCIIAKEKKEELQTLVMQFEKAM